MTPERRELLAFGLSALIAAPAGAASAAGIGGPFELIDQNGQPYSDRQLVGRPSMIFFGYTYCPEVCPTTLVSIGRWLKQLGPAGNGLNVLYVSVDPERDTPTHMREYLSAFDPRIRGLTGSVAQVAKAAAAYRVYYRKVPLGGGAYAVDHSAAVYLLDRQGRFVEPIGYGESDARAVAAIRRVSALP